MIITDKKLIYFHIPKCAGKSVEKLFLGKPQANPHNRDWALRQQVVKGKHSNFYKFTIVRNPIDRTLSIYNYYLNGGNKGKSDKKIQDYFKKTDINKFISELKDLQGEIISKHMLGAQHRWVYHKGHLLLNTVLLFDDLPDNINYLISKYKLKGTFPHLNKSQKKVGFEDLTIKSIKKLKIYYKKDFELIKRVRQGDL